ncbi:quorum-sensing system DWW-type pheromone [Streptococcus dysgalactiae]|nr:quorum-sensing system DWW-type pheromone [Streptococcus dysgalactiae]
MFKRYHYYFILTAMLAFKAAQMISQVDWWCL